MILIPKRQANVLPRIMSHKVEEENYRPEHLSKSVEIYYKWIQTPLMGRVPKNGLPLKLTGLGVYIYQKSSLSTWSLFDWFSLSFFV